MPALDAALAFAQADDIPIGVGQDLELDMTRTLHKLFHVEVAIAEGCRGLRLRRLE